MPEKERRSVGAIVLAASIEIRRSITFATVIIVLVFLPVFFLSGVEGRLLAPLGLAYVVSLLASLVVAMTVTPVLCYFLLPSSKAVAREKEAWLAVVLKKRYAKILPGILRHPWWSAIPTLALLALAVFQMTLFGRAFLPPFNEGSLTIGAVTLPGTSLEESDEIGKTDRPDSQGPSRGGVVRTAHRACGAGRTCDGRRIVGDRSAAQDAGS